MPSTVLILPPPANLEKLQKFLNSPEIGFVDTDMMLAELLPYLADRDVTKLFKVVNMMLLGDMLFSGPETPSLAVMSELSDMILAALGDIGYTIKQYVPFYTSVQHRGYKPCSYLTVAVTY